MFFFSFPFNPKKQNPKEQDSDSETGLDFFFRGKSPFYNRINRCIISESKESV